MFKLNDDNSIYVTRGDVLFFDVSAHEDDKPHKFQAGDVLRIKVYGKKNAGMVVLQKDFPVVDIAEKVTIFLESEDTKIGDVISKPKDYWYEVELNPDYDPQTIIGYDENGAAVFKLFPEGADIDHYEPDPEDFPVVDDEFDMASPRPISNRAVSQAYYHLQEGYEATHAAVAKLHVTPQMYGAIGDGEADDTQAILDAIAAMGNGVNTLYFPTGVYMVSEDIPLVSNITLHGEGANSVIKRMGTDATNYNVLYCGGIENVTIKDLHIQGDRDEHIGTTGEWGMCIGLCDSRNISIANCKLTNGWGDGVYIGRVLDNSGDGGCENISIDNCLIDQNRRNGVSVIECDGFRLTNSKVTNANGTAPKSGIDFEPNEATQFIKNCIVENCFFGGNVTDISFYDRNGADVSILNCNMRGKYGLLYDSSIPEEKITTGGVTVLNCNFNNSGYCYFSNRKHINSVPVSLVGCVLCADTLAIQIGGASITYDHKMGDIHFVDCYVVKSPHNTGWVRYQNQNTLMPLEDVTLDVRLGSGAPYHNFYTNVAKCRLDADIKCSPKTYTEDISIDRYNTEPLIAFDTRNNECAVDLAHSVPYGMPITIRKLYDAYDVTILLDSETFGQFDYASSFSFSGRFDEVTLIHEADGIWRVVDNTASGVTV